MEEIDSLVKHIWLKVVKEEYEEGRILEESSLHATVYFHLRGLIERRKGNEGKLFLYSEMPFSTTIRSKGERYPRVDLAIVNLNEDKGIPIELLAALELKHYETHLNSIGIEKDLDHLNAIRKGIYYPYSKYPTKLKTDRAYFLYLVDGGKISFDGRLLRKMERLKQDGYLKVFLGEGENEKFYMR